MIKFWCFQKGDGTLLVHPVPSYSIHPLDLFDQDIQLFSFIVLSFLGMPSETSVAICSMIFGGVLEKFPKLKVCFAHGGN